MIRELLSATHFDAEMRLNLDESGLLEPLTNIFNFAREIMLP